MTKHREILRLSDMGLSQAAIAASCAVSKKSVSKTLKAAREKGIDKKPDGLTNANCWAHARRSFADAVKAAGKKNPAAVKIEGGQFRATALFSLQRRGCSIHNGRGVQPRRRIQRKSSPASMHP